MRARRLRTIAGTVLAGLVLAACAPDGPSSPGTSGSGTTEPSSPSPSTTSPSTSPTSSPTASPTGSGRLAGVEFDLEQLAVLTQPVGFAVRPGDDRFYLVEQTGRVVSIDPAGGEPAEVLDLTDEVRVDYEQGLLGLAFSPDGAYLYVNYTEVDGDTRVVEYATTADGVDPGSARGVLEVSDPYPNHNGGNLVFGPDGYLYIGLGDGGGGGDPEDNGQDLTVHLGKMLRIIPRSDGGRPYGIPEDNPFVGTDSGLPEIWAYGLRNPWRYSFDRETGDLWIGDVGQGDREEIDFQAAGAEGGANYGWDIMEGTLQVEGTEPPAGHVPPVHEYPTGQGCAVTGGYVYRGQAIPDLGGAYLFADHCNGRIHAIRLQDGEVVEEEAFDVMVRSLSSFGEDLDGELYVLALSGEVYRIVP